MADRIYFDELPEEWKAAWRERRRRDLEAIEVMDFPVEGTWGARAGSRIRVFGPAKRFMSGGNRSSRDNFQLLCEWLDPRDRERSSSPRCRAVMMAYEVFVDGRALLTRCPPQRPEPCALERMLVRAGGKL